MFSLDAHNLRNDGGIKYEKNRIGNNISYTGWIWSSILYYGIRDCTA